MSDRTSASHPATETKLSRARRNGVVPKSAALTGSIQMLLCFGALWATWQLFPLDFTEATRSFWSEDSLRAVSCDQVVAVIQSWLWAATGWLLPLGVGVFAAGVIANYVQTGPMFPASRLRPGGGGGGRKPGEWFSWLTLAKWFLGCGKIAAVTLVAGAFLWSHRERVFSASTLPVPQMIQVWFTVYLQVCLASSATLSAVAVLDFGATWLAFQHRMKMTDAEIREELKQQEGDPQIRQSRRQQHRHITAVAADETRLTQLPSFKG